MAGPVALVPSRAGYAKIGKEAVARGTAAASLLSLETDSRSLAAKQGRIKPRALTNSVHDLLENVQGRKWSDGDLAGIARSDSLGHLLMGIFGTDAISGAGPYTHTFTVNPTTPSYTIEKNVGGLSGASNSEQYLNMVMSRLVLSASPEQRDGVVRYAASFLGKHPTKITASAYTKPPQKPFPSPLCTFKYATVQTDAVITQWQVTLERAVTAAEGASNSRDIDDAVATIFKASGFIEAYFLNWTAFYDDFVADNEKAIELITTISANEIIDIFVTGAYFDDHAPNEGGDVVKQRLNFEGIFKSADSGAAKVILTNNTAVAF